MIDIKPEQHPNIRYVDKVTVVNAIGDWGLPPIVRQRSRGLFKHVCWIGTVEGERFTFGRQMSKAHRREMVNQIEDWCKENLTEIYLTHLISGKWCFRILLMNEMDAFRVKMRWGGEQFAHIEFREPEVILPKSSRG